MAPKFQLTPPIQRATSWFQDTIPLRGFQLTPPIQRATAKCTFDVAVKIFQLTPPIQRATDVKGKRLYVLEISTHAPYTEGDRC